MFHSRNGLFFCRLNDTGEVRIIKTRDGRMPDPDTNPPEWAITLPENEWASVVCSVSAAGETSARWMCARQFHGTELPRYTGQSGNEIVAQRDVHLAALNALRESLVFASMHTPISNPAHPCRAALIAKFDDIAAEIKTLYPRHGSATQCF